MIYLENGLLIHLLLTKIMINLIKLYYFIKFMMNVLSKLILLISFISTFTILIIGTIFGINGLIIGGIIGIFSSVILAISLMILYSSISNNPSENNAIIVINPLPV